MMISEAIEILKKHAQFWRGSTNPPGQTPLEIAIDEVILAAQRYETLRKLNVRQFAELCKRNSEGEVFDDMVDALTSGKIG